jgi:hypothetical protein
VGAVEPADPGDVRAAGEEPARNGKYAGPVVDGKQDTAVV